MTHAGSGTRAMLDNLVSGYAYLGFTALVTLLLVPVYVTALGPSQWGVVAWCMALQGVLFSIDAALSPLLLRDASRAAAAERLQATETRFLRLYVGVAVLACLVGLGVVALLPSTLPDGAVPALCLALLQFLVQFANGAAIGTWHALQRQRFANLRLVGFAIVKHVLALALVLFWQATPLAYFLPFVAIGAIEFLVNRLRRRRERAAETTPASPAPGETASRHVDGWRGLTGYAIVAVLAVAMTHIDRIVLATRLDASGFGLYFLLGTVLLSALHLQMPLQRSFLPRIATALAPRRATRAMLVATLGLLVLPCLLAAFLAEPLLRLWLHDAALAAAGAPTLRWMLLAAAALALSGPGMLLLLAQRRYGALVALQGSALLAQTAVLWRLAPSGPEAGGLAWLAAGCVQLAGVALVSLQERAVRADSSSRD